MNNRFRFPLNLATVSKTIGSLLAKLDFSTRESFPSIGRIKDPGNVEIGESAKVTLRTVNGLIISPSVVEFWGLDIQEKKVHGCILIKENYGWFEISCKV